MSSDRFAGIFDRYHGAVYRFFSRRGLSPADCEELTQETFLGIYQGMETFRGEASLDTWVFRIAANFWRQFLRRRSAGKRSGSVVALDADDAEGGAKVADLTAPGAEILEGVIARERVAALRSAVAELPARMRRCVLLRFHQQLSYREIARLLGISVQTVKVQLFRARRRLRAHQIEQFGDPDL